MDWRVPVRRREVSSTRRAFGRCKLPLHQLPQDVGRRIRSVASTFVVFAPEKFQWVQGELGTYAATPDLVRAFCRDCGSPVASWRMSEQDKWIIAWAGAFDQAEKLEPRHHIFAKDELPWLRLEDGLPCHELFPENVLESLGLDNTTRHEQME